MRNLWMILTSVVMMFGLAACGSEGLVTAGPDRNETQAAATVPAPESMQTQTLDETEAVSPDATDVATDVTPDAQKMVDLAKEHLAQELGIAGEQITVAEVDPVVWRDASLGCPKPAIDYIRVETPGYRIVLESGGATYDYHTDEVNRVVLCDTP